jgi:hypothetical protein
VATLANRACQWTCPWAWVSIATTPIAESASFAWVSTRPPINAEDRTRFIPVDDGAIGAASGHDRRQPRASSWSAPSRPVLPELLVADGGRVELEQGRRGEGDLESRSVARTFGVGTNPQWPPNDACHGRTVVVPARAPRRGAGGGPLGRRGSVRCRRIGPIPVRAETRCATGVAKKAGGPRRLSPGAGVGEFGSGRGRSRWSHASARGAGRAERHGAFDGPRRCRRSRRRVPRQRASVSLTST